MKKLSFAFIFILFSFNCFSQNKNCSSFKTGEFKIIDKGETTILVRTKNKQTEIQKNKPNAIFKVKWVNDCTYELIPTKKTAKTFGWKTDWIVTVTILKTEVDYYTQRSTSNFSDVVFESKVYRIKK